jgi:hypothetical protein
MKSPLFKTICYAVALAVGMAVIITNSVSPMAATSVTTMLALGLVAIGLASLQQ